MEDYLQYEKSDDICCHGDVSQCFSRDHIKRYIGENDIGNYFVYCISRYYIDSGLSGNRYRI